jgi:hypothetical protein
VSGSFWSGTIYSLQDVIDRNAVRSHSISLGSIASVLIVLSLSTTSGQMLQNAVPLGAEERQEAVVIGREYPVRAAANAAIQLLENNLSEYTTCTSGDALATRRSLTRSPLGSGRARCADALTTPGDSARDARTRRATFSDHGSDRRSDQSPLRDKSFSTSR